jgi:hypothetical protein
MTGGSRAQKSQFLYMMPPPAPVWAGSRLPVVGALGHPGALYTWAPGFQPISHAFRPIAAEFSNYTNYFH